MGTRAKPLLLLAILAGGALAVVASWAVVDTVFHATGDDAFCSQCHSHAPIGSSYRESLHGGNNAVGWRATCADCHIPQDNALRYFWVKSLHGIVDPTMELLKDPHDIDWHGNRARRTEYVYDSGCLSCHLHLEQRTSANFKAILPHRRYFAGDDLSCVECHQHVGHARLGHHLEAMGWQDNQGDQP